MTADDCQAKLPCHQEHSYCRALPQRWAEVKALGKQQGLCVHDIAKVVMHWHDHLTQPEFVAGSADRELALGHRRCWLQGQSPASLAFASWDC